MSTPLGACLHFHSSIERPAAEAAAEDIVIARGLLESAGAEPPRFPNPAKHLDCAMHEAVAATYFAVPTEAVEVAARKAAP